MVSSSKGTQDGPCDGAQDWEVDWLESIKFIVDLGLGCFYLEARLLLYRQGGTTVAKVPVSRLFLSF